MLGTTKEEILLKTCQNVCSYYTSCPVGALEGSEAHGPWISQI